jgi:hypothetical protein
MPFRHISPENFSIDLLKQMQAAYDGACETLAIDSTNDPRSAKLANIIIELAANGEQKLLRQRALEQATAMGLGPQANYPSDGTDLSNKTSGDNP